MPAPKPITLTQMDAEDYTDAAHAPQPFVVVGDLPIEGSTIEPQEAPEVDAEPADVDALAAQVIALRDALVDAGVFTAP